MGKIPRPINRHDLYHAHIYYDEETLEQATDLCLRIAEQFDMTVGFMHKRPVGPHPMWSCQISFNKAQFDTLIPWLERQRDGLKIFVHGLTGNGLKDHTDYAYWLGDSVPLNLSIFKADHSE